MLNLICLPTAALMLDKGFNSSLTLVLGMILSGTRIYSGRRSSHPFCYCHLSALRKTAAQKNLLKRYYKLTYTPYAAKVFSRV